MKLYLATSWRNPNQEKALAALRQVGFTVYDFKHPSPWQDGFAWSETDLQWEQWKNADWTYAIRSDARARRAFSDDFLAMQTSDACIMLSPSGRSAHIEAGYFVGARKPLYIVLTDEQPPELMYNMATRVCSRLSEAIHDLIVDTAAMSVHPGQNSTLYNGTQDRLSHWCACVRQSVAAFADSKGGKRLAEGTYAIETQYGRLELRGSLTGIDGWFADLDRALAGLPHGPCDRLRPNGWIFWQSRFDLRDPYSLVQDVATELSL